MKYLLVLSLLFAGCSNEKSPGYTRTYVDTETLTECSPSIVKATKAYVHFTANNGDVLYIASMGGAICLKRHKNER